MLSASRLHRRHRVSSALTLRSQPRVLSTDYMGCVRVIVHVHVPS
jgi:hypothetical protein